MSTQRAADPVALAKLTELPEETQDAIASRLLAEIEDEEQWAAAFADPRSHALLKRLIDQAMEDERAGRTEPIESWLDEDEESGTAI